MDPANTPNRIALLRGLETGVIVALVEAVLFIIVGAQAQSANCSAAPASMTAGAAYVNNCEWNWHPILWGALTAFLAGLTNAVTAFSTSIHALVVGPSITTHDPLTPGGPSGSSIDKKIPITAEQAAAAQAAAAPPITIVTKGP